MIDKHWKDKFAYCLLIYKILVKNVCEFVD